MNREYIAYSLGQLSLVGATFIFNLAAAHLLGPEQMGIWQTAYLFPIYGILGTFGLLNGLGREIPFSRGRNDAQGVAATVATSFWFISAIVAILFIAGSAIAVRDANSSKVLWLGLFLFAAQLANSFSTMLLRSFQRFTRLGVQQAITATLLGLGLLWLWISPALTTMLIVVSAALLGGVFLAARQLHFRPVALPTFRRLVAIGIPIMLAGFLFSLLTTIDRVLILSLLGKTELGLYTPVITALGAMMIAPRLVSNVMYPRIARLYGETGAYGELIPLVLRMIRWNFLATVPISILFGVLFYFLVVPHFLPAFSESRIPLIIALSSSVFLPLGLSFGDFFNVVGCQRLYLRNMAVGFLVNCMAGFIFVRYADLALSGIAMGTVCGFAIFTVLQAHTFWKVFQSKPRTMDA